MMQIILAGNGDPQDTIQEGLIHSARQQTLLLTCYRDRSTGMVYGALGSAMITDGKV